MLCSHLACLSFKEPGPLTVMCFLGAEGLTLVCPTSVDGTMVSVSYSCSYEDGPAEDCEFCIPCKQCGMTVDCVSGGPGPEIPIAVDRFPTGALVRLTVRVTTGGGQSGEATEIVTVRGKRLVMTFEEYPDIRTFFCRSCVEVCGHCVTPQHIPGL